MATLAHHETGVKRSDTSRRSQAVGKSQSTGVGVNVKQGVIDKSKLPSTRPRRDSDYTLASMDPADFLEPEHPPFPNEYQSQWLVDPYFDYRAELSANYDAYYVKKVPGVSWIQMHATPAQLNNTITKIKANVWQGKSEPSLYPSICCAIRNGIPYLLADEHISKLIELRKMFERMKQQGTPHEEFVFDYFDMTLKTEFAGSRHNMTCPDDLKSKLMELSHGTGMMQSDIAVWAAIEVVSRCEECPQEYKDRWSRVTRNMYKLVEAKSRGAISLMESL